MRATACAALLLTLASPALAQSGQVPSPAGPPSVPAGASPEAWSLYRQGHAAQVSGDLQAALGPLDQAIAMSPRFFMAYMDRGVVYFKMKRFEPAAADFSKAIEVGKPDPTLRFAYKLLGSCYRQLDRPLDAVRVYSQYIDGMGMDDWDGVAQRGEAYAQAHDAAKARQDYQRALQLSPDNPRVMGMITALDLQVADWPHALEDSTRWLALDPSQTLAAQAQALARSHL